VPRVSLYSLNPSLSRPAGTGLSFPRQNHPGHVLRTYLSSPQKNQSQHGFRWSSCRYQRSRGRYLAGQLYELQSWLRRSGGKKSATSRQSVWPKSVTYVAGTFCYLSVRAGQRIIWRRGWDTHPADFGILPCFQGDARKPHEYWRFLPPRILQLFQLFRMNSINFARKQTPKTRSFVARDEKAYPHSMGKDWPLADAWVLVIT
jgi:hypothetical protein